jgi:hypothetical protein
MSNPIAAARFAELVKNAEIPYVFHEGWQTRNRNQGRTYGPVHGVLLHHTVTTGLRTTLRIVRDVGQGPAVPAPLYNGLVDKEGILHVIGWGRVNHAGLGDDDVLRAVIAEQPLPVPNEANTDGNARFYGFAGINMGDGKDRWPPAQLQTLAEVAGIICREHGWNERSVVGHREWQPGKIDPYGSTGSLMGPLRTLVREVVR